jgi:multiple sugar transport system substrate-binding protein
VKKICLILAVLAVPALLFAGGQRSDSGSGSQYLRFAWWGNSVRDERTNQVVQLFMRANPGVTVEPEPTAWDGYWSKMNTQVAGGNLPDVMQQSTTYIQQYTERNQLVDFYTVRDRGLLDLSKWPESSLGSGILFGKLVGLDIGTNTWGMAVDAEALRRAGISVGDTKWTWQDDERIAIEVFQKTGIQTMPITSFDQVVENIVRQFGDSLFSRDQKSFGFINNPAAIAAVKEVQFDMQLRLKAAGALYNIEDAFVMGKAMEEEPFSLGRTWNTYTWSNQYVGFKTAAKRPIEYYITPSISGMKAPYGTYYHPSMYISMLSSSRNQDLAAKFINFFVNDIEANRILMAERGVPVPTNVRTDLTSRVNDDMRYLFNYINKVSPFTSPMDPPEPATAAEAKDMTRLVLLRVLSGQTGSDAGMNQIIQESTAILRR